MVRSRLLLSLGVPALVVGLVCLAFVPAAPQDATTDKPAGAAPAARDGKAPQDAKAAKTAKGTKVAEAAVVALPAESGGSYALDPVHSTVIFRIRHADVSWSYGRFNEVGGGFVIDAAHPEQCSIGFTVSAASVDTANGKRDQHLKSPDFLNATEFPEITFKSDKVALLPDGRLEVSGELTFHGVTRPLTVQVELVGAAAGLGGAPSAGFETTFLIKRSDFGMDYLLEALGDDVRITVSVEGQKAE